jgi:hypothetical protein
MALTARIASALLAAAVLYLGAALAIGPDDANKHLCEVVAQLWSSAGVQCSTSLGPYALRAAFVLAALCIGALSLDLALWLRRRRGTKRKEGNLQSFVGEPPSIVAPARISVLAMLDLATERGWHFPGARDALYEFEVGLRQAASEGQIEIWGVEVRSGFDLKTAKSIYVSEKIDPEFFKRNQIDAHQGWMHRESSYVRTSRPSGDNAPFYADLDVDRTQAASWLAGEGERIRLRLPSQRSKSLKQEYLDAVRSPQAVVPSSDYLSLYEATFLLINENTPFDAMARAQGGNGDGVVTWWAYWISNKGIQIVGDLLPTRAQRPFDKDRFWIRVEGKSLIGSEKSGGGKYENLRILSSDMAQLLDNAKKGIY